MNLEKNKYHLPFLKWTGGKRWFADEILSVFPDTFGTYYEPFLGGGAIFFALQPEKAILSDLNSELINLYKILKGRPFEFISKLEQLKIKSEEFYRIRSETPEESIDRAIRMYYLNKTAFNGMYRVNKEGMFNVPFGCKPGTTLCPKDFLLETSKHLKNAKLLVRDFSKSFEMAERGDLVFADPPYTMMHNTNGFLKYNEKIFSWEDQERLASLSLKAKKRGVRIVVTNADHLDIRKLYSGFRFKTLTRSSCISASPKGRKKIQELLIY